jgi:hypothetical protein
VPRLRAPTRGARLFALRRIGVTLRPVDDDVGRRLTSDRNRLGNRIARP